jgi:hypothetical protein
MRPTVMLVLHPRLSVLHPRPFVPPTLPSTSRPVWLGLPARFLHFVRLGPLDQILHPVRPMMDAHFQLPTT